MTSPKVKKGDLAILIHSPAEGPIRGLVISVGKYARVSYRRPHRNEESAWFEPDLRREVDAPINSGERGRKYVRAYRSMDEFRAFEHGAVLRERLMRKLNYEGSALPLAGLKNACASLGVSTQLEAL